MFTDHITTFMLTTNKDNGGKALIMQTKLKYFKQHALKANGGNVTSVTHQHVTAGFH